MRATPPDAVLPGELGTLLDEVADPRDVTATIVDLAVRGYLEIHEEPASGSGESGEDEDDDGDDDAAEDWRLVATDRSRADLTGFEQRLLADLFADRASVRMSEVRETFASSMAAVQGLLYEHVTERGWFRGNPATVRSHWYLAGGLLLVPGLVVAGIGIASLVDGLALLGVVLVVLGVVVLALAKQAPARTSSGTGVLAEAVAFKRYLETASPDSLRVLHGEDLFSRYLPYAIVFGLTEQWAGVFGDLAARGERVPEPTWYHGYGAGYLYWGLPAGSVRASRASPRWRPSRSPRRRRRRPGRPAPAAGSPVGESAAGAAEAGERE
ncbi:DUF2207 domain-containing protein [Cellulomonas sp. ATA003]|uniref:DUF2207 domain-containing protein n=1 Tax=Cellulomonas sp. ATA003 TaxID=3073064 RepID=UPI00287348F5|nr:DUF2207 domain-containing protein [Cellulomonas sp. ATA003]WNB86432.1 DUF2207 domain-containing protein [Cellulomonas sp. ATA003]